MVRVEEGREFRFRGDLYSQESTFPLVEIVVFSWNHCEVSSHLSQQIYSKNKQTNAAVFPVNHSPRRDMANLTLTLVFVCG